MVEMSNKARALAKLEALQVEWLEQREMRDSNDSDQEAYFEWMYAH